MSLLANNVRYTSEQSIVASDAGLYSSAGQASVAIGSPLSAGVTWLTANDIYYFPFILEYAATAYQMAIMNSATVSGNLDIGLYNLAGTRLVNSGSTAQAGTSAIQVVNITDTPLQPGAYYMALQFDNTTATVEGRSTGTDAPLNEIFGIKTQSAGALGLPATASFASTPATGRVFHISTFLHATV